MTEWHINEMIRYLHNVISGVMTGCVCSNPVFDRLFQLGVISLFHQINDDLEKLNKDLDVSVILEGVSIDFDTYLDDRYWKDNYLFKDESSFYKVATGLDVKDISCRFQINQMTDYLPNGVEEYTITQDLIDTFKNSLNQLCDRNKLGSREILYALYSGRVYMIKLLKEIKEKVEHPKPHQYIKVWEEIYEMRGNTTSSQSYDDWKEENEGYKAGDLKRQHIHEIFKLLESRFFRYFKSITGADVKNRKLIITGDDLPVGCNISDSLPVECAKFEKFFEWKEDFIVSMNYEKLGQYIYKNYSKLDYSDLSRIVEFDKTVDKINEDMAVLKPNLAKYLKSYDDTIVSQLIKDCSSILNTCQSYLAKDIRQTFLQDYLRKLLFDKDMRDEARKKLSSASRNTYICEMVAALKNARVFKVDCDKNDLARSIGEKITTVQVANLAKYIERSYNDNDGALNRWTKKIVEDLKQKTNIFEGIV
ncbi:MAG: hypothetical protein J5965_27980 [Aeriscardovia sp.]|nr:hypothetical protein [Aeriscardovia sp.]